MRLVRALSVAVLPLAAALAAPSVAHAESYAFLGYGDTLEMGGDFDRLFGADENWAAKIGVGYRRGQLAGELSISGMDMTNHSGAVEWSTTSVGAELKYFIPIVGSLEGHGQLEGAVHGGLHKVWFGDERGSSTYFGWGTLLGLGLQYRFRLPFAPAAVWFDYTRESLHTDTAAENDPLVGSVGRYMLGVSFTFSSL